jgi:hypothetical protein
MLIMRANIIINVIDWGHLLTNIVTDWGQITDNMLHIGGNYLEFL